MKKSGSSEYFPIQYSEPTNDPENRAILGLDMFSEDARRRSLEKARDTGDMVVTGQIKLARGEGTLLGFRVFLPVYENHKPHETLEERRRHLIGFISGLFLFQDPIDEASGKRDRAKRLVLSLYDDSASSDDRVLFAPQSQQSITAKSGPKRGRFDPGNLKYETGMTVGDRNWRIVITPTDDFYRSFPMWPEWLVLTFGFLLMSLFLLYLYNIFCRNAQVQKLVSEQNADIISLNTLLREELKEREKAQRLMTESEERFRLLTLTSQDAIMIADQGGSTVFWNEAAAKMFLHPREEVLGKNLFDLIAPSSARESFKRNFQLSRPPGKDPMVGKTIELAARKKDGSEFLMELSVSTANLHGNWHTLGVARDITSRKRTEEQLQKLSRAVEQSPASIVITDVHGNIEYVNPYFSEVTGYQPQEVMGKNPRILKSGKQDAAFYKNLWDVILSGKNWQGEFENRRKNGQIFWESASIAPLKNREGLVTHFVGVKEDITKRKFLEQELRKSKAFFETMVTFLPVAVFVKDQEGRFIYWNKKSEKLFGFSSEQIYLKTGFELFPEDQAAFFQKHDLQVFEKGEVVDIPEELVSSSDHTEKTLHTIKAPIYDESGKPQYILGISEDISDRKRYEQLKDEFIATVSHEIRTPMTIIREGVSQFLDGILGDVTEEQKSILNISLDAIDRLGRIINDLLDMSKLESGKVELKKELVDIASVASKACRDFGLRAHAKGVQISLTAPEGRVETYADPDKIMQVFTNLIGNALKFTDEGLVDVSVSDFVDFVECSVRDSGRGISNEDLPRVFSKFEQFSRQPGAGEKGTGLGLAISKGIVDLHKGKIWVESKVGHGTKFTFALPKFNETELFREYVTARINQARRAKTYFSVATFELANLEDLKNKLGEVRCGTLLDEMGQLVRDNLRRKTDASLRSVKGVFVMLIGTDKTGATAFAGRIRPFIDDYLTKHGLIGEVKVITRVISYPDDGTTEADLTKILLSN